MTFQNKVALWGGDNTYCKPNIDYINYLEKLKDLSEFNSAIFLFLNLCHSIKQDAAYSRTELDFPPPSYQSIIGIQGTPVKVCLK